MARDFKFFASDIRKSQQAIAENIANMARGLNSVNRRIG
jgi:hypothetical protein